MGSLQPAGSESHRSGCSDPEAVSGGAKQREQDVRATCTRFTFTAFRTPHQARQTLTLNDLHMRKVRDPTFGGKRQEQGQNE